MFHLPAAKPNTTAYVYCEDAVIVMPLMIVATPPNVMATLFNSIASTLSNELKKPHTIRAIVFAIPMAETMNVADPCSIPAAIARWEMYKNGTKKPIMVKNPLRANRINDGDLSRLKSNMVANVRRTASGHN